MLPMFRTKREITEVLNLIQDTNDVNSASAIFLRSPVNFELFLVAQSRVQLALDFGWASGPKVLCQAGGERRRMQTLGSSCLSPNQQSSHLVQRLCQL